MQHHGESSVWKRAAQSLSAHLRTLEDMLRRMKEEHARLSPILVKELIRSELAIRRVERDLQTVKARLIRPS